MLPDYRDSNLCIGILICDSRIPYFTAPPATGIKPVAGGAFTAKEM